MSDERPAGESPTGETPAPEADAFASAAHAGAGERPEGIEEHPAAPAQSPVRQGIMAALTLFGISVGVELAALLLVRLSGDPNGNVAGIFLIAGMGIFVVGLFAALTITTKLPSAARLPFWAMGVVCIFVTMILWGVTCGLAGTPRFG